MTLAQSAGIDAFALNIGSDSWTLNRVQLAYSAAQTIGFKCFISFDMTIINSASQIITTVSSVSGLPAQYKYNGRVFVSTFGGAGVNMGYSSDVAAWNYINSSLVSQNIDIFFVPNFEVWVGTMFETYPSINGAFSWAAWPDPMSVASELTTIDDDYYMEYCNDDNKVYLAPVSPWFYTHLSYKNYLYHCDSLWYDRWQQLIFDIRPPMIEIITWNDWGESSYIGPIDPDSADLPSGSPAYVDGFPHISWLNTLPYFISYYKTGVAPTVNQDVVVYWYRPFLKASVASNDPYGPPSVLFQNTSVSPYTPAQTVADYVFVLTILVSPGTVQVTSGSSTVSQSVPAGANLFSTALNTGYQTITLLRNSNQVCSSLGAVSVGTSPVAYNYNAYVSGCQSSSKRKIQITQ